MPFGAILGAVAGPLIGGLLSDDNGAEGMNDASAESSRIQAQIGKEQWERYQRAGIPLEDAFIEQSRGVGSQANQNKHAQQAAADVAGRFAGVRERLNKTPGLRPNSQAYLQEANKINLAEAAASAAGQTGARENTRTAGRAATTDALSLIKGMPAQATSALGASASGLGAAGRWAQQQGNYEAEGIGRMVGGITNSAGFKKWMDTPSVNDGGYSSGTGSAYGGTTTDDMFTPLRAGM